MDTKSFGERLKYARKQNKMTAEALAEKIGITSKSIWQLESGYRGTSLDVLIKLCNNLNVSPQYLLHGSLEEGLNDICYDELMSLVIELSSLEREMAMDYIKSLIENRGKYRKLKDIP